MKKTILLILLVAIFLVVISAKSCQNRNSGNTKSGSSNYNTFVINAPSALTAAAVSSFQINLSWSDNSNNEDGFEIERSSNGIDYLLLATIYSDTAPYSDATVSPFITYYYRVRAFNTIGDKSTWSDKISVNTIEPVWIAIAAGSFHSLGLAINGAIWAWGNNRYGQLGLSDTNDRYSPSRIVLIRCKVRGD